MEWSMVESFHVTSVTRCPSGAAEAMRNPLLNQKAGGAAKPKPKAKGKGGGGVADLGKGFSMFSSMLKSKKEQDDERNKAARKIGLAYRRYLTVSFRGRIPTHTGPCVLRPYRAGGGLTDSSSESRRKQLLQALLSAVLSRRERTTEHG
jgi:hypothetical protein